MKNNLSSEPPIHLMGTVVGYEKQKDQVKGGGWGWRYKVAIFDTYSSKESDIDDADIEYAIAMASNSDGSGGANRRRSMRISQGDTVMIQKYGGKRGISIITGILPKSKDTVRGSGRFDAKSGYFGDLQAKGLFGSKQEFSENAGHETPETTPKCTNKDKTVPAKKNEEKFKELGLGDAENAKGQLKKPPGNELINSGTDLKEDEIKKLVAEEKAISDVSPENNPDPASNTVQQDDSIGAQLDTELAAAQQGDRSGLEGALDIS